MNNKHDIWTDFYELLSGIPHCSSLSSILDSLSLHVSNGEMRRERQKEEALIKSVGLRKVDTIIEVRIIIYTVVIVHKNIHILFQLDIN